MLLFFIGGYLLLIFGIGWWVFCWVYFMKDFVIVGCNLFMVVVVFVFFVIWFGFEIIMGVSLEFVEYGLIGVIEDFFGVVFCLVFVGVFFVCLLYKLNIIIFNDFFCICFSWQVEVIFVLFMIFFYFGWIVVQFVVMVIIFNIIVGFILLQGILFCVLIVVFYIYIGGMWVVFIIDFLQIIMIIIGLLIIVW